MNTVNFNFDGFCLTAHYEDDTDSGILEDVTFEDSADSIIGLLGQAVIDTANIAINRDQAARRQATLSNRESMIKHGRFA